MTQLRRGALLAVALAAVASSAVACSSATGGTGTSSGPVTSPASTSAASLPASTPASTPVSTPTTSVAKSTPASSPPAGSTSPRPRPRTSQPAPSSTPPPSTSAAPPPPGSGACTADQLTASAIRGGAYQGREVAGVLFTNSSSSACTVRGYPFAQLRYHGQPLGKPAKDDPGTVRTITLQPGQSAQSQLTAVTTCQAPISDHVRVIAPDTTQPDTVPMQLRGCSLSIGPLEAA